MRVVVYQKELELRLFESEVNPYYDGADKCLQRCRCSGKVLTDKTLKKEKMNMNMIEWSMREFV